MCNKMENAVIERINKIIKWYIFLELVENNADLSVKLGYQPSYFSQILGGKVPISEKFITKLCSLDDNINKVWILTGEGNMLFSGEIVQNSPKNIVNGNGNITSNGDIHNSGTIDNRQYYSDSPDVLRAQIDLLDERIKEKDAQIKEKDAQISRLLTILEKTSK